MPGSGYRCKCVKPCCRCCHQWARDCMLSTHPASISPLCTGSAHRPLINPWRTFSALTNASASQMTPPSAHPSKIFGNFTTIYFFVATTAAGAEDPAFAACAFATRASITCKVACCDVTSVWPGRPAWAGDVT
jgi:hypothetical protein